MQPMTGTHTIHPLLGIFPKPLPLSLAIEAFTEDGKRAPVASLQKAEDTPLFVGKLTAPGQRAAYDLVYRPDEKSGQFLADWPKQLAAKGEYTLDVALVRDASAPIWLPTGTEHATRSFQRADTLLTMPWSLVALLILILLVVLDVVAVRLASGPLAGAALIFTKQDRKGVTEEVGQVNISGMLNRHRYVAKRSQLEGLGRFDRIEVEATKSDDPNATLAANIHLTWSADDGGASVTDDLAGVLEGETVRIGEGFRMQLKKESASAIPLWLWGWIVVTLVAWIATFGYLYLTA
jgi:hypothetical protein